MKDMTVEGTLLPDREEPVEAAIEGPPEDEDTLPSASGSAFEAVTSPTGDEKVKELEAWNEEVRKLEEAVVTTEKAMVGAQTKKELKVHEETLEIVQKKLRTAKSLVAKASKAAGVQAPASTTPTKVATTWLFVTADEHYIPLDKDYVQGRPHGFNGYKAWMTEFGGYDPNDEDAVLPPADFVVQDLTTDYGSKERTVIKDGVRFFNLYKPSVVVPKRGRCKGILKVIKNLVDSDRAGFKWFLGWIANMTQAALVHGKPVRMRTVPGYFGIPGSGKNLCFKVIAQVLGPTNTRALDPDTVGSRFSSDIARLLLVFLDEATSGGNLFSSETTGKLKIWATEDMIREERKGKDAVEVKASFNMMLGSNVDRPTAVERDDRRNVLFNATRKLELDSDGKVIDPDVRALTDELDAMTLYYDDTARPIPSTPQLAAFAHLLLTMKPHRLTKPYVQLKTEATERVKEIGKDPFDVYIDELREEGLAPMVNAFESRNVQPGELRKYGQNDLYAVTFTHPSGDHDIVVHPGRLYDLHLEWHRSRYKKAPTVPRRTAVTRFNKEFDGGHEVAVPLAGSKRPRVLKGVVWEKPSNVTTLPVKVEPVAEQANLHASDFSA